MNGFALIGEALLIWFRQVCLEKNLAQVSAFSFWSFQLHIQVFFLKDSLPYIHGHTIRVSLQDEKIVL